MDEIIMAYVGIDVSKRKLDVAWLSADKVKSKVFENTPAGFETLHAWLQLRGGIPGQVHVCMEATGPYSETLATALVDQGWTVSVVNPARIKGFAQSQMVRNKTDRTDAVLLARFCAALRPAPWTPPPPAWRELRALVDRLQAVKDMRQQELNRLEACAATQETRVAGEIREHVAYLVEVIRRLEQDIRDHIDRHPPLKADAQLLSSIPGLGNTSIAKILAYAGDVRRFSNAKALAAYIGVSPRQKQSGSSIRGRTVLARSGHSALRRALYMPGLVALRHNPILQNFGERLRAQGLAPKAVVGAAMRKLAHLIYGIIKSGKPFDPAFSANIA